MREDPLDNVHALLQFETAGNTAGPAEPPAALRGRVNGFKRYEVNLMVSGGGEAGAPVVTEDNPTLPNLIGLVEHSAEMGDRKRVVSGKRVSVRVALGGRHIIKQKNKNQ